VITNIFNVSVEITKYILVYHKCLSVHSAVTLTINPKNNRRNYEISYKNALKSYLSGSKAL